jgi:hypothetical protein
MCSFLKEKKTSRILLILRCVRSLPSTLYRLFLFYSQFLIFPFVQQKKIDVCLFHIFCNFFTCLSMMPTLHPYAYAYGMVWPYIYMVCIIICHMHMHPYAVPYAYASYHMYIPYAYMPCHIMVWHHAYCMTIWWYVIWCMHDGHGPDHMVWMRHGHADMLIWFGSYAWAIIW